jgi:hypothetical protein
VRTSCGRQIDNQTAFSDSQLYFVEGHNAGADLTSESRSKGDNEACASDRSYKNYHLLDHIDLNYFPGRLELLSQSMHRTLIDA